MYYTVLLYYCIMYYYFDLFSMYYTYIHTHTHTHTGPKINTRQMRWESTLASKCKGISDLLAVKTFQKYNNAM